VIASADAPATIDSQMQLGRRRAERASWKMPMIDGRAAHRGGGSVVDIVVVDAGEEERRRRSAGVRRSRC